MWYSNIMEFILILPLAGVAMALFSTVVMAFYAILEDEHHKKEIKRYARRQIIKQMEHQKQIAVSGQETVDMLTDYK
jgi:uncharacterized protein YbcI